MPVNGEDVYVYRIIYLLDTYLLSNEFACMNKIQNQRSYVIGFPGGGGGGG